MNPTLYRVILPVSNIDLAEKFYVQIFQKKGIRVSPGRHYFDLGGTILACYDPVADGDPAGKWEFHENQYIYISVSDLEALRTEMLHSTAKSVGKISEMPWGETLFYANDPFGNPICFVDENTVFTGK